MHVYDICTDIYTHRRTHLHIQELRKDMDSVGSRVKAMRKRAAKLYTKKQQVFFLCFCASLYVRKTGARTQEDNTASQSAASFDVLGRRVMFLADV